MFRWPALRCVYVSFVFLLSSLMIQPLVFFETHASAQERDSLYIIYDSSNSMWGELSDGSRKYEAGRSALANFLASRIPGRDLAFRAYGHNRRGDCRDSSLVVPFTSWTGASGAINDFANRIKPRGKTPINYSLREALKDFGERKGDILLISDGIESCDADPCALMQQWQNRGINLKVHVVGFGLKDYESQALACIASISGGSYFDANSAGGLVEALTEIRQVAAAPAPPVVKNTTGPVPPRVAPQVAPQQAPQVERYALRVVAVDERGRSFIAAGKLYKDNAEIGNAFTHRRMALDGPGRYRVEIGVVLADRSIYKPAGVDFEVKNGGETVVEVQVARPAIVTAEFTENEDPHRGSVVSAVQGGRTVFSLRPFDEVLARPGVYQFRTAPNKDNELSLTETLVEGEETVLNFDLAKTVRAFFTFRLGNGDLLKRNSALYSGGQRRYLVHANTGVQARPGAYELHSDDPRAPLTPAQVVIPDRDGEVIEVPLAVGYLKVRYEAGADYKTKPDRARIKSLDRRSEVNIRIDTSVPVAPGAYEINGWSGAGEFAPQRVDVSEGETVQVMLRPGAMGQVLVIYPPSDNYLTPPNRAHLKALDGQKSLNARAGKPKKVATGRYQVEGWVTAGYFAPVQINVVAGQTTEVVLEPKPLGTVSIAYKPSQNYKRKPDRAHLKPLEGQKAVNVRVGKPKKVLPGRYEVLGWPAAGDVASQQIDVVAGQTLDVVLGLKGE